MEIPKLMKKKIPVDDSDTSELGEMLADNLQENTPHKSDYSSGPLDDLP